MFRKFFGRFRIRDVARAAVAVFRLLIGWVLSGFRVFGVYRVDCYNAQGVLKWTAFAPNAVVTAGLNHILGIVLGAGTQVTAWYIGLVDNASFTAFSAADTMGSHTGWIEVTAYSQSTRVAWSPGSASAGSITNGSSSNFSISGTKVVKGLFLSSDSAKSGTTGTLFSEAAFSGGNQSVGSGDTLQITYTVNATSS